MLDKMECFHLIHVVMVICGMLFGMTSGECDSGMHEIAGSCYSFDNSIQKTAYGAEMECPVIGAGRYLASFGSQSELDTVYNYFSSRVGVTSALAIWAKNAFNGVPSSDCEIIVYGSMLQSEDCSISHRFLCEADMEVSTTAVTEAMTTYQMSSTSSTLIAPTTAVAVVTTEPLTTTSQYTTTSSTTPATSGTTISTSTNPTTIFSTSPSSSTLIAPTTAIAVVTTEPHTTTRQYTTTSSTTPATSVTTTSTSTDPTTIFSTSLSSSTLIAPTTAVAVVTTEPHTTIRQYTTTSSTTPATSVTTTSTSTDPTTILSTSPSALTTRKSSHYEPTHTCHSNIDVIYDVINICNSNNQKQRALVYISQCWPVAAGT
ncbi:cell wall protein DAN4-like [Strongylocentrotus purpuratus]|uniref:C-type lectin domain-containing protein n=1 Tax=Strongylocentrotus purpuratus TaxID=7668 RepID=A0A7M7NJ51_STRPU|nr:cell wall protein DAN4-like [Strongylocentrotus purpuratus]